MQVKWLNLTTWVVAFMLVITIKANVELAVCVCTVVRLLALGPKPIIYDVAPRNRRNSVYIIAFFLGYLGRQPRAPSTQKYGSYSTLGPLHPKIR